ncbi:hypothetical protein [Phenylobacterium sp.]|uniref:hypothetical protein n=1 Tax=Phenylobacterium sp. TaxID=1871053 RepID=UPI002F9444D9
MASAEPCQPAHEPTPPRRSGMRRAAILAFFGRHGPAWLPPADACALCAWAEAQLARERPLPGSPRRLQWPVIAVEAGVDLQTLRIAARGLRPGFAALLRELGAAPPVRASTPPSRRRAAPAQQRQRSRRPPPGGFAAALDAAMRQAGETDGALAAALGHAEPVAAGRIAMWRRGAARPRTAAGLARVAAIERRYDLPAGALSELLGPAAAAEVPPPTLYDDAGRRLPAGFADLAREQQAEILAWVRSVYHGASRARVYQKSASEHAFALVFDDRSRAVAGLRAAPDALAAQAAQLVAFKTARFAPAGQLRHGIWSPATAGQQLHHLGLLFGALAAPATGPARGLGAPRDSLTFALLCVPAVWDWYIAWREARRGFLSPWEHRMVGGAGALARAGTGWLAQRPDLAQTLKPIPGLLEAGEVARLQADWAGACRAFEGFSRMRAKEVERLARVSRTLTRRSCRCCRRARRWRSTSRSPPTSWPGRPTRPATRSGRRRPGRTT